MKHAPAMNGNASAAPAMPTACARAVTCVEHVACRVGHAWPPVVGLVLLLFGMSGSARAQEGASGLDAGVPAARPKDRDGGGVPADGAADASVAPAAVEPGASEPARPSPPALLSASLVLWPEGLPAPAGVVVLLTVTTEGDAADVVVETADLPEAGVAAIEEAARELRFEPATGVDGEPIPARIRFKFDVYADDTPPAAPPAPAGSGEPGSVSPSSAPSDAPAADEGAPVMAAATFGARARVTPREPGAASQIRLRGAELTMVPGTFGEPLRVVSALPGVARTPYGLGFFAVRGASLQNTGFLVDGFPVPLLYHLGAGPAILSSRLVDRLDFHAGGYPLAYGRYTAGLIGLHTRPPDTEGPLLEFEVDLLKASAMVVTPFDEGRGRVAVAARRSYFELVLPLITDDVSLSYTDYQVRADYRLSNRVAASLFFFGSRDSLQFSQAIGSGQTMGQAAGGIAYSFDRVIGSVRYRIADPLKLTWAATAGPSAIDFGQESTGDASLGVDTSSVRLGQRLSLAYTPNVFARTTLGVEQNVWINELTGSAPSFGGWPFVPAPQSTRESIPVEDRLSEVTIAPYLEQVVRPGPFEITGGLRLEHYRYGEVAILAPEPRGVVRLQATEGLTFKAASGLFSQAPLPFQFNRSFGNPDLRPNRALQSSMGLEAKLFGDVELETTGFYNVMWQLTRASGEPAVDEEGQPTLLLFRDDGRGRAYGWEVLIRRKVQDGLFGWLSYTLSRSERFLGDGDPVPFFFDQTHVLNLAASYQLGRLRLGGRFMLATGRPQLDRQPLPDRSDVVFDTDGDGYVIESGGRRTRLPTFHQLDIRIDYAFEIGPLESGVFLDIINVYSAPNSEGFVSSHDLRERGRVPGLPFLPTIGFRGVLQ